MFQNIIINKIKDSRLFSIEFKNEIIKYYKILNNNQKKYLFKILNNEKNILIKYLKNLKNNENIAFEEIKFNFERINTKKLKFLSNENKELSQTELENILLKLENI